MVLNRDQTVAVLYDLAMSMAGETRPRPLATLMLQRLLSHTGCGCGAVLLDTPSSADGGQIYLAVGNPALRALEGRPFDWPAGIAAAEDAKLEQGWFPGGSKYRHALDLDLPGLGRILLFSTSAPENPAEWKRLFAPVMAKFASELRHCIESEAASEALSRSEARYRGILESATDWIWETDKAGLISFSNSKVTDLLGYTPEEVAGRSLFDLMPASEGRHASWTFRDIAADRRPFFNLENTVLHKDGHSVDLETSGAPVVDANGNFSGYCGISRDITARKQAEEAMVKAHFDAEAANRAKSVFLSSMGHELRTPLNAILGYAQLIETQEGQSEENIESAHEIRQAGQNLLALMNDILELARIESGQMEKQIETFALSGVIETCLAQNSEAAKWRKVPLNCTTICTHCSVTADRRCMLQVLNKLVSNAIKYNREGGQVSISCRVSDGRLKISVSDNGPGIDSEKQKQLFQPFNRLGAEMGRSRGTGIGLAIARQLVEGMGGTIGVESTPGTGSTFWVELPAPASDTKPEECPAVPKPKAKRENNLFGARVLVAEDYAPNQALLQIQLSSLGCEADIASDGAEALEKWTTGQYDLILTDLNMPIMDGPGLASAVRKREAGSSRHTPIICVTATDRTVELQPCYDAGMDDTLTKPVALEALRSKLARWLGSGMQVQQTAPIAAAASIEAVLDLDSLYSVLGEVNLDQGCKLIATFIQSAGKGLEQLASSADSVAMSREMHKQKSSARTVGALRYAKLAETIEGEAKKGAGAGFASSLAALRESLAEVKTAAAKLRGAAQKPEPSLSPQTSYGPLLVVDDDPVVLQQMTAMLASLGAREVLTASNGFDALELLHERNGSLDTLICDLNMPGMDGVELIRLFGRTGFKGRLILMSGADEKVLSTVSKLADLQGLRVLGQLQKPITPEQMLGLLSRENIPRARKRQATAAPEVSSQAIRDAIARDEFTVWFQPKVDAKTLRPVGVEALARWQHPDRGMVSPDIFIGVAEREGLVGELSQILASRALMEGAQLHNAGFPLTIAINLSGLWLDDLLLPEFMFATTQAAGLRTSDVILEVTETGVMKEVTTALDVLTRLRLKGFGLSIDDFGIGYSSFEQLDRIPFTELKLDRSFVSKGTQDATASAILQSSMDMARKMALSTVAEGVETEADLELVRAMGCDRVQGYLIAKPMTTEDLIAWLKAR